MRKGILLALVASGYLGSSLGAQPSAPTQLPAAENIEAQPPQKTVVDPPATNTAVLPANAFVVRESASGIRFWASAEYLLWWSTQPNLPPLVTLGDLADPFPGALGQPGSTVLFGGGQQDYGQMNGLRFTMGGWCCNNWGWEASGFVFENQSSGFSGGSDALGNPPLYFPIFRPDVNREGVIRISQPLNQLLGYAEIGTKSQFWGIESNALYRLDSCRPWSIALIGGFKYLDLQEGVTIGADFSSPLFDIQNVIRESFNTRSQFYGGQIGIKAARQWGVLSLEATGKVALGCTNSVVNIEGSNTVTGTGAAPAGTFNEGIYTQTSNIGRHTASDFAVVPQGQIKAGVDVLTNLRATFGYDVLYWNRVVRAGEQIDRNVDVTQSQAFGLGGAAISPAPQINRSGYWAHGLSFGLEFRY